MSKFCTIFVGDGRWRVACVDGADAEVVVIDSAADAELSVKASTAAEQVAAFGGDKAVVVALPSNWCLSASIQTDDLPRNGRRQAMGYRLEEHLPVSSEDIVTDYVDRHGVAMGVCALLDQVEPIIQSLEAAGLVVQHLCPAAMLAGARLASDETEADGLLLIDESNSAGLDLVEVDHKSPRCWWWHSDGQAMRKQIHTWSSETQDDGLRLAVLGEMPDLPEFIDVRQSVDSELSAAAAHEAACVLAGDAVPWIDLRRDALGTTNRHQAYQKHAFTLIASVVLLFACVIGATYWRGEQYKLEADRVYSEQVSLFKEVFPNRRAGGSLLTQLKRERDTLAGLGGQPLVAAGDNASELYPISVLTQLEAVLGALPATPAQPRYQVSDLVIEPDLVRIDGKAESHQAASQVAAALRSQGAYVVEQPNSRAIGDGVFGYSFFARPKPSAVAGGTP